MNKRITIAAICFLIIGCFLIWYTFPFSKGESVDTEKHQSFFKNGSWIHEQDSLAGIEIKDGQMIFFYKGEETLEDDIYDISFSKSISHLSDSSIRQTDFIELTNKQDTMKFEILGYNDSVLSLLSLPNGRIHIYAPEVKD